MRVLMVMDAIESINPTKDSSLALMLAAKAKDYALEYCQIDNLYLQAGDAYANASKVDVFDDTNQWFQYLSNQQPVKLHDYDVILMRKDPPFDINYYYATLILEHAHQSGALVVNAPSALRQLNEKMAIQWFKDLCPPSLVTCKLDLLENFIQHHKKVVLKPLDVMAGTGIFLAEKNSPNTKVIIENMTFNFKKPIIAQTFIPAVKKGDRRVMIIDGVPFAYGLKRIPKSGEFRANLAQGGTPEPYQLKSFDLELGQKVGDFLKQKGVIFAGIDLIGDYLTEINVTSPTCIREIDQAYQVDIASRIWDAIDTKVSSFAMK